MSALAGLLGVVIGILRRQVPGAVARHRAAQGSGRSTWWSRLHAEIAAGRTAASEQSAGPNAAYMVENDFPAGPSDRTDFVFEALKSDLSILPQQVIHQVVLYYRLAEQSNLMVEFLWTDIYARQNEVERRRFRENLLAGLKDQERAAGRLARCAGRLHAPDRPAADVSENLRATLPQPYGIRREDGWGRSSMNTFCNFQDGYSRISKTPVAPCPS